MMTSERDVLIGVVLLFSGLFVGILLEAQRRVRGWK